MPAPGFGMLITLINVDAADEPGFNHWFDKEHLPERVRIDGFINGRRYQALQGQDKYLTVCTTRSMDVLDSPAYRQVISQPTQLTRHYIGTFRTGSRSIVSVVQSHGQGHGGFLAFVTIPAARQAAAGFSERIGTLLADYVTQHDICAAHWVQCNPALSKSFTASDSAAPMDDGYCMIEGNTQAAVAAKAQELIAALQDDQAADPAGTTPVLTGVYGLMSALEKNEL